MIEDAGGNYSPYGKAEAAEVTQLAPETFGSYATLYNVGGIYTATSSASMHESESGYIQLVGAPLANLGDRFVAAGPYVSSMDISVNATGGVTTSYKFNTWTPEFGKLAKYNVDRIAKINKNNWARAQKLRGRITKPPFPKIKFEKTNFDSVITSFFFTNNIKYSTFFNFNNCDRHRLTTFHKLSCHSYFCSY